MQTPNFDIKLDRVETDLDALLQQNQTLIDELGKIESPTWENFVIPLDALSDKLHQFWSPVSHLNSVANNDALREVYNACLPKLSDYYSDIGQNEALYKNYLALRDSEDFQKLNPTQQRVIDLAIRDFKLSGIGLNTEDKKRYKEIVSELSRLTTKYEENILDATKAWSHLITDVEELKGVPEYRLHAMQEAAHAKNKQGYLISLDFPCYHDVITFADNRTLREQLYQAFCTRASDLGPNAGEFDNSELMQNIITLRAQLASLLGFDNYAQMSLETKMAKSPIEVEVFLNGLVNKVKPHAEDALQELQAFVNTEYDAIELQAWDVPYYSEKLRQQKYNISQEEVKPYFPVDKVISGLFSIIEKLYGIRLQEKDYANLWHKDAKFYQLLDKNDAVIGGIFMDLFARDNKRGGAWMDDAVDRWRTANGEVQLPIAYLTCNFAPATQKTPALLTHHDVETLFHEMGHCLQHLLTKVDCLDVSGINNVPWDTVEFPSQFFEAWTWQPEGLALISGHYETGEPLPQAMIEKLIAAKNFQAGLFLIRQLEFAIFDMALFAAPVSADLSQKILQQTRDAVAIMQPPAYNRFAHAFSHIFAGGYAAGYYSYLWAEVLARDAFSLFKQQGLFDAALGARFKDTVLGLGGSEEPEVIFEQFMGRKPDSDALLNWYGF